MTLTHITRSAAHVRVHQSIRPAIVPLRTRAGQGRVTVGQRPIGIRIDVSRFASQASCRTAKAITLTQGGEIIFVSSAAEIGESGACARCDVEIIPLQLGGALGALHWRLLANVC